jgi:glutaredoxin
VTVVLYGKPGECSLCEEAREVLERVKARAPFELLEVDIREDPEVFARFKYDIPVVFVEGREAFRHRVDERALLRLLGR